eukprot:jgi/Bigna1/70488/fgenesh1_pg.12_\
MSNPKESSSVAGSSTSSTSSALISMLAFSAAMLHFACVLRSHARGQLEIRVGATVIPITPESLSILHTISKPVPIWAMAWLVSQWARPSFHNYHYNRGVMWGLLLSSLGDILLLPVVDIFIGGLGSFLVAHLLYIWAFGLPKLRIASVGLLLICLLYAGGMFVVLEPHLQPELKIPVIVYALVIGTMGWSAIAKLFSSTGERGGGNIIMAALGSLVFIASDTILALRDFHPAVPKRSVNAQLAVMITYYLAQALLCASCGFSRQEDLRKDKSE